MQIASIKTCPRCKKAFECKANDIANCQCSVVKLKESESVWIAQQYTDCLCIDCLLAIQKELAIEDKA